MIRRRRSLIFVSLAIVLLAALLPGLTLQDFASPEPPFILLAERSVATTDHRTPVDVEQLRSLAATAFPRPPPVAPSEI